MNQIESRVRVFHGVDQRGVIGEITLNDFCFRPGATFHQFGSANQAPNAVPGQFQIFYKPAAHVPRGAGQNNGFSVFYQKLNSDL